MRDTHIKTTSLFIILLVCLVACTPSAPPSTPPTLPTSTRLPTRTLTPSPTPQPSPTASATPLPPPDMTLYWPRQASALYPPLARVNLAPASRVPVTASLHASVLDPEGFTWQSFELKARTRTTYVAEEALQIPLWATDGEWQLIVQAHIPGPDGDPAGTEVYLEHRVAFRPVALRFHDLSSALHPGVMLHVPQAFTQSLWQGDAWAGARAWRFGDGEIGLWWAPGPTEALLKNTAIAMLEASRDPQAPVQILRVEETHWQGRTAFLFEEAWPAGSPDLECAPAQALVVQGDDFWLYVLRIRAQTEAEIAPLLRLVWNSFSFSEEPGMR